MPRQSKASKKRLDVLLVERGLVESRPRAQALILAGQVLVNRQKAEKAGALLAADSAIELLGQSFPYASRGGVKLAAALDEFAVSPVSRVCLDVGSSTGGFTDCLLQRGAARVYAVDVNVDQMAWKLQQDPRVVRVKRNARFLKPEEIGEAVDLVTLDLSFISVAQVLPAVVPIAKLGADLLILVKPQFELDKSDVGKAGIVRDARSHQKAIERVRAAAQAAGLEVLDVRPSRLPGAAGNLEFFLHARRPTLR